MSRNSSPQRTAGDSDSGEDGGQRPADGAAQDAGQVSEAVAREHTASSNQVRHEPIKSSHHSEDEDAEPPESADE
jgi:hypothetical protein